MQLTPDSSSDVDPCLELIASMVDGAPLLMDMGTLIVKDSLRQIGTVLLQTPRGSSIALNRPNLPYG